jgi:hypothetical protein
MYPTSICKIIDGKVSTFNLPAEIVRRAEQHQATDNFLC